MAKMEVTEMLDGMEEEMLRSIGFIAGTVTKTFAINMIGRKKAEACAKEECWAGSGPDAYRKEDGAGEDLGDDAGHRSGGEVEACPGKGPERYGDLLIYVPAERQVIRIAEGSGDNLHREDIEDGYVDYIYYEQHEAGAGMPVVDGGQVMLEKPLRDRYQCMAGCIPDVLDLAYGNSRLDYMVL